jgi:trans-2,3-dihydro-3-hydroxyanthranilate isomerase
MGGGVIPAPIDWYQHSPLHQYYVCDVFTAEPLQGNQLAVFVDGRSLRALDMQLIAREMNISETVFLFPAHNGGTVAVRIFTPKAELPFAGHPVLGTAFVVGEALGVDAVDLETGVGTVRVVLMRDRGHVVCGRMSQPVPTWERFGPEAALLRALGVERSALPVELYRNGPEHVYVKLSSEQAVAELSPDMQRLSQLAVGANCFAGEGREWKTRMFHPAAGVPEDPATGSAAGPLAVHLVRHHLISPGVEISIRQGEEIGRRSQLQAVAFGTAERIDRVEVGGSAVIVGEGRYRISRRYGRDAYGRRGERDCADDI